MSDDTITSKISYVKIYPPLGIARLGDSGFDLESPSGSENPVTYFPPEIPGSVELPPGINGNFRDEHRRIKRQAVRFRVYAYDKDGKILEEITKSKGYTINWKVHVANHKGSYYRFFGQYDKEAKDEKKRHLRNPDIQPIDGNEIKKPEDRKKLIVDAGEQKISSSDTKSLELHGDFHGSASQPVTVHLGYIKTDPEHGHLIFVGGAGYSRSVGDPQNKHHQPDIISEFDSIDWVDDTCDGWVDVEVRKGHFSQTALWKATVLSAPPNFAWGVRSPTTLYDVIENIYKGVWTDHKKASFYQDIWPAMLSAYALSWVNYDAYEGHGVAGKGNFLYSEDKLKTKGQPVHSEDKHKTKDRVPDEIQQLRDHIFDRLRAPDYVNINQASNKYMPRLSGNKGDALEAADPLPLHDDAPLVERFAALTKLQYERFTKWRQGDFDNDPAPWDKYQGKKFEDVALSLQPRFLTLAALEHTAGEPLMPGIEMHWSARLPEMYDLSHDHRLGKHDTDPPFRINHTKYPPGHVCRGLSLPWQSDFSQCNTHWWPSSRPDDVFHFDDFKPLANERTGHTSINITEEEFIEKISPLRRKWTRGLRDTPEFPSEYYPGATDMVRYWQNLGFVAKDNRFTIGQHDLPVWAEKERKPIRRRASDEIIKF